MVLNNQRSYWYCRMSKFKLCFSDFFVFRFLLFEKMISQDLDLFVAILLKFRRSGFRQNDRTWNGEGCQNGQAIIEAIGDVFCQAWYVRGKQVAKNFLVVVGERAKFKFDLDAWKRLVPPSTAQGSSE